MNSRSMLLLEHHLKELKLPSFLREYGKMAAQCAAEGGPSRVPAAAGGTGAHRPPPAHGGRADTGARFPAVKSLDTFDFLAIPSLNKALVMELARCEYIQRRDSVIAIGNRSRSVRPALGWACNRPISSAG